MEPAEPIEQQPRITMAHTLPPRRKCQTLQCCINRRLWLCRAGAWDRGQEPPPCGHTDSKVSHLSTLLLFFVFLSVGVWSIFGWFLLTSMCFFHHFWLTCVFFFYLALSLSLPPQSLWITEKPRSTSQTPPALLMAPSTTVEVANGPSWMYYVGGECTNFDPRWMLYLDQESLCLMAILDYSHCWQLSAIEFNVTLMRNFPLHLDKCSPCTSRRTWSYNVQHEAW